MCFFGRRLTHVDQTNLFMWTIETTAISVNLCALASKWYFSLDWLIELNYWILRCRQANIVKCWKTLECLPASLLLFCWLLFAFFSVFDHLKFLCCSVSQFCVELSEQWRVHLFIFIYFFCNRTANTTSAVVEAVSMSENKRSDSAMVNRLTESWRKKASKPFVSKQSDEKRWKISMVSIWKHQSSPVNFKHVFNNAKE